MFKSLFKYIGLLLITGLTLTTTAFAAGGDSFAITLSVTNQTPANVVTNCNDSGPGSLRYVLASAEADWEILFDITTAEAGYSTGESYPGLVTEGSNTWFRIIVNSALPTVANNGVYVNGSSQTREASNSLGPEVELRANGSSFNGLYVTANNVTIEGLAIGGFAGTSYAGINFGNCQNAWVKGCYLGTRPTGEGVVANYSGIYIYGTTNNNHLIGGSTTAEDNRILYNTYNGITISGADGITIEGNVISGNGGGSVNEGGVYLTSDADYNRIIGNKIGTNADGTAALANNKNGITLNTGCDYNIIGGATEAERNIISGNNSGGIYIVDSSNSNEVTSNYIGLSANGGSLANAGEGIYLNTNAEYNIIGPNNYIANNTSDGVKVASSINYALITQNSLEANTGGGINLLSGANQNIAYPVIAQSAYDGSQYTTLTGTAPANAVVEIFKTESSPDPSGQGEGVLYLGSTEASGSGDWSATIEGVSSGDKVTATASLYLSPGYTSEFALNSTVSIDATGPTVTIEAPDGGELWQGGATYEVTWTATDESGISQIRLYYTTGESWVTIATGEANDGAYSWQTPLIDTAEARVSIEAVDSSAQQNVGTTESAANFTIDSTPPGLPTLVTPGNGTTTTDATPTLTWEAATDNLSGIASYEITLDATLITQGATTTYTSGTLTNGWHTWEVKAKDNAQNWGVYSASFTFEVITSGPVVSGISLSDITTESQVYTNGQLITVEAAGVSGRPDQMILSENSDFSGTSWQNYLNPTNFTLSASDGTKEVYYKIRNGALTESSTVSASIILDRTAPSAPSLTSPANNSYTSEARPVFNWSAATDALSGIASYEIIINTPTIATLGAVTTYTPGADLAAGSHTWEVRAKDKAQNWGAFSATWNLTVDATAPTVQLLSPDGGEQIGAFAGTQTISWSATDTVGLAATPITLEFSSNSGTSWSTIASGLANSGSYAWTVTPTSSATCRVRVTAIDLAGNTASAMSASDFTIDAVTPEASLSSLTTGLPITGEVVIAFTESMSRDSVSLTLTPTLSGSLTWSNSDQTLTFGHTAAFDYLTTYTVTIAAGATDLFQNPMAQTTLSFTTEPRDSEKPNIIVKIADLAIRSDDFIDRDSDFDIVITDNQSIDAGSVRVDFDDAEVVYFISLLTPTEMDISYGVTGLAAGEHSLTVQASDISGNTETKEVTGLTVVTGPAEVRDLIVSPMPMAPGHGETGKIAYLLNKDVDIRIIMYSPAGELIWNRRYAAGTNGGKAGYNEVSFSGVSDVSSSILGNGIYVFRIVAEGKALGKGHIVIYD